MAEKFYQNCKLFDARCAHHDNPKMQRIITKSTSLTKEGRVNYDKSPSDNYFDEAREVCADLVQFIYIPKVQSV